MFLHLGAGPIQDPDPRWLHTDPDPSWGLTIADPAVGLPWGDDVFAGAYANHVLNMVPWSGLVPWLTEVRRVLQPGAPLRLLVPDLLSGIQHYIDGNTHAYCITDDQEPSIDGKLCLWLSQGGATRSVFTPSWIRELCLRAGFDHAAYMEFGHSATDGLAAFDTRPDESCVIEAW